MKSFETHPGKASLGIWFYLLLTITVAWDLGRPGYRFFTSSGVGEPSACDLDSFSEPSIATAILKLEVQRLFSAYARQRDLELERASAGRSVRGSNQPYAALGPRDETGCETAAARRAEGSTATIQSLEHLRAEVEGLKGDLELRLLAIHCETGFWPEFLDEYLKFLRECPENRFVVDFAGCALEHAQGCERSGEVVEALEHAAQIQPKSKTSGRLREFLAQRRPEESRGVQAPSP